MDDDQGGGGQAAPVIMDREATIDKAIACLHGAAGAVSQLVLCPEAFVPAYPRGLGFSVVGRRTGAGRRAWARYGANAVVIPDPATGRLGAAVRAAGVHLAIEVIERDHSPRPVCPGPPPLPHRPRPGPAPARRYPRDAGPATMSF